MLLHDDLAEGKPTLPLIFALQHVNASQKQLLTTAIKEGGLEHLDEIISIVRESGALEYTRKKAEERIAIALDCLSVVPDSTYKTGLELITQTAIERTK